MVAGALDTILIPSLRLEEIASDGSTLSNPAADSRRLFLGEDGYLHLRDSAGNITDPVATGGAGIAGDPLWDTAGDLAVASGANTAAKLAKGAAGANLSTYNGVVAWNGGTSFPASPATGDRYWRSDLGLECYYDGTRWLTTTLFSDAMSRVAVNPVTTGGQVQYYAAIGTARDIYVVDFITSSFVLTTNSGSHYWTISLEKNTAAASATSIGTVVTSADTPSNWVSHTTSINAVVVVATYPQIQVTSAKTLGTPGNIFYGARFTYRLVVT